MAVNFNPRSNHIKPLVVDRSFALGNLVFSSANNDSRVWADWGLAARYALTFYLRSAYMGPAVDNQLTAILPFRSF